ncbi:MAG: hypothetical protein HQM09_18495 [Candidatus Riflebacteria bacterium]|nr:hypothetical protein [Candidatus Riflebacteria bacterium]
MIAQITAGKRRIRVYLLHESGKTKNLTFPVEMLAEASAVEWAANDMLKIVGTARAVFHTGNCPGFETLLALLERSMSGRFHPLVFFPSSVEWGFSDPRKLQAERILAIHGAAELWPEASVVLVRLDVPPVFDVVQNAAHLAGFEPIGFEELLQKYFPNVPGFLRNDPRHVGSIFGTPSPQLASRLFIEGSVTAWRKYIRETYLKDGPPLFVSYGDDDAGLRLFADLSDIHRPDLIDIGACRLALLQWEKLSDRSET